MSGIIYVQSCDGTPLMPTRRKRHVRDLLRHGQAKIVECVPFVIRLMYDGPKETQPLYGGTDPGRTNIGNAVLNEMGEVLYKDHITTRNKDIPTLMAERKGHRQQSRRGERLARKRIAKRLGTTTKCLEGRILPGCNEPVMFKDIINTEARFNNRKRAAGWITPTTRHLIQTHVNMIKHICRILPVTNWTFETNRFAFMLMEDGTVQGRDFQNGRLRNFADVYDYVWNQQNGKCICCGKPIEHYHHIVPRHNKGSDRPENIIGICSKCHEEIHTGQRDIIAIGEKKKYAALSVLNQAVPFIESELSKIFGDNFVTCTGYETSSLREYFEISKDHDNDAVCIASYQISPDFISDTQPTHEIRQFRRHNRQIIHSQRERTYCLDGKMIAKNRKPRFEQNGKALSDLNLTQKELARLTVKPSRRYYNNMERQLMPGTEFFYHGQRYIMSGQQNNGFYLLAVGSKMRFKTSECGIVKLNRGLVYVS